MLLVCLAIALILQEPRATVRVDVRAQDAPVAGAAVTVGGSSAITDAEGIARLNVAPGRLEITVTRDGFVPAAADVEAVAGEERTVTVHLLPLEEEVTVVGSTRTERPDRRPADAGRGACARRDRRTLFASRIADPLVVDRERYLLRNLDDETTNVGAELLATVRREPFAVTGTYTYVRSRETERRERIDVPLTPRRSAGIVAMAESEDAGRLGVEVYFTAGSGSKRIRIGTVGAWAPLDGRTING